MKYPNNITMADTGWARIHKGHGLNHDALREDLAKELGQGLPDQEMRIRELYFAYTPRVKWCEPYGHACALNGEWHGHWSEVRPNDDSAVTIVEWHRVPAPATS